MKTAFLAVFALVAVAALAHAAPIRSRAVVIEDGDDQACGTPCDNNNQCMGTQCTRCDSAVTFTCVAGQQCGQNCSVDSDCNPNGNCPLCQDGFCGSQGLCNQYCRVNSDCIVAGSCDTCVNNLCKSGCGVGCMEDLDCQYSGSQCQNCIAGTCQLGGCFANCHDSSDCAGQGNCTVCNSAMCTSTCGGGCTSDAQCAGASTGCGHCAANGTCVTGICGSACSNNGACGGNGECTACVNGSCAQGAACGAACNVNTDCNQHGKCTICSPNHVCIPMN